MAWRERHKAAWFPGAAALAAMGLLAPAAGVAGAKTRASAPASTGSGTSTSPSPSHHQGATSSKTQSADTGFWDCPPRTTKVSVTVHTLTVRSGSPLTLSFIVHNTGSRSCNYIAPAGGTVPGPATTRHLDAGPCGSLVFEIDDDNDHNVWPGPFVFNCPALGFTHLRPGASVSGTGTWDGTKPGVDAPLPAGRYTLLVDGHFRFPLRVASSSRR